MKFLLQVFLIAIVVGILKAAPTTEVTTKNDEPTYKTLGAVPPVPHESINSEAKEVYDKIRPVRQSETSSTSSPTPYTSLKSSFLPAIYPTPLGSLGYDAVRENSEDALTKTSSSTMNPTIGKTV